MRFEPVLRPLVLQFRVTHAVPEHADRGCFHAQLTRDLDVALACEFQRVNLRRFSVAQPRGTAISALW
jgi:hypothetical protein